MGDDNRGQSVTRLYNGTLFVAINVNTLGEYEKISKIKVFHYINNTQGYLFVIDYSSENFTLGINSSNVSNLIELDLNGLIPGYDIPEPEPEPEQELYTITEVLGDPIIYTYTPFTFFIYPIAGNGVKEGDVIGIFVGDENRSTYSSAQINNHPTIANTLFATINVSTSGTVNSPEIISKIKVFHYVTQTEGYVSIIDISSNNYEIIQGSSNVSQPFQLDL